jgi:hypothetical protein
MSSPQLFIGSQQITAASVPVNTVTVLTMDTESVDTGGGHSDTSNPSRFYVPVTGWWLVRGCVAYVAGSTFNGFSFVAGFGCGQSSTVTDYEGGKSGGSASKFVIQNAAELLYCTTASPITNSDYLQLYAFQNAASTVNTQIGGSAFPWMSARWVATGPGTGGLSVPANPSYSDTTEITGAFLNANMRDAVNYLSYPPMARLSGLGGSQSIASSTFPAGTAVTFATATMPVSGGNSDNYSGWSSGTNPTRYTFARAGRYFCYGQVSFAASTSGQYAAGLRVNGGTTIWGTRVNASTTTSVGTCPVAEQYIRVNAGDYVELIGSQNSGSSVALVTVAPSYSKLLVIWEGS